MLFYFYGSSKLNPGEEGSRGIIHYPRGNTVSTFLCGLGISTNNQAEKYTIFFSLEHAISLDIQFIVVIWDSLLIVSQYRHNTPLMNNSSD